MPSFMLVISAQDIQTFTVGLAQNFQLQKQQTWNVPPEDYLEKIQESLTSWNVSFDFLQAIIIVTGPGSATASRVSVTIANSLGFAFHLPLYGRENPDQVSLEQYLSFVSTQDPEDFVYPFYQTTPHITQSKKLFS
ncbi:TPA: hypothetical protein DDZ01_01980 [Candidatus Uhrbacteria bacterium]|nr:MAG: hypothetical protein A2332_01400 [Candidatus Uhrbacteria bacterium RIFOXYB2_FULL_41_18]HBK34742.1 hypothetical protein [Candidatus Uhrbacteria bacterium]HCB55843.1 hypothetical protein [Candidatus Uhrbacteria bacterium]